MKLMKFLMGFDDCYRLVRSVLLTRDPLTKVKDEHIIMSKEESHKEEELKDDAVTLLKRIRKFSTTQAIGACVAVHIFNRISFAIAKEVGA
ncbi:hypothetical protein Tco_0755721 [Tanacetum coccineum]